MEHARYTLPAIRALRPSEIILATDAITDKNHAAVDAARRLLEGSPFRIIEYERSPDWNHHLSYVVHESVKAASSPRVLVCNIDDCPRPAILEPAAFLGEDWTAIAGGQGLPDPRQHGSRRRILWLFEQERKMAPTYNMTGTYWIYRPYYLRAVAESDYQRVLNGSDGYVFLAVLRSRFKAHSTPRITHQLLEPEHAELPEQSFLKGVHGAANYARRRWWSVGLVPFVRGSRGFRAGWLFGLLRPEHHLTRSVRGRHPWEVQCFFRIRSIRPLRYDCAPSPAGAAGSR